jgi:hypothetical protein
MATKPMKRAKRFDEGDLVTGTTNVRTRSDDVIGDTNPRTGVYTPGSYDRNRANGEENLKAVKGLWNRITGGSSDDAGTGTRGLKASVSSSPSESDTAKAKVISDSFKPKASVVDRPSQSTISGSQVDKDKNYDSESESSAPETKPSSKLPITVEGDYPKKSDTSTDTDEKSAAKTENKKPAKTEDKKPAKTETKRTDASSSGDEMSRYANTKKAETKRTDASSSGDEMSKYANTKKAETKKPDTKPAAKTDYYRGSDGKMHPKTAEPAPKSEYEWGTQNIKRNLQNAPGDIMSGIKKVGSALSNFETIAERRSREAKEAKNKPVAKRSGGAVKKMASGGMASSRGDGIAQRGKTRGKMC